MVKLRKKSNRRPPPLLDLAVASDRKRANTDLYWGDHGFLRLRFQNLHRISDEMWRSNQPSPKQIADHARERGIKTILNLRGASPKGYYLLEKEACEANEIALVDFQVFSRDTPKPETILAANALFDSIAYPALMHCKSGADRAGIMAVLYKLLRQKTPFDEARRQLSLKYLHVKQGKTGILNAVLDAYEYDNEKLPQSFLDWSQTRYDPAAIKAEFLASGKSNLNIDQVLGRE